LDVSESIFVGGQSMKELDTVFDQLISTYPRSEFEE
jgi:hypothetical protein